MQQKKKKNSIAVYNLVSWSKMEIQYHCATMFLMLDGITFVVKSKKKWFLIHKKKKESVLDLCKLFFRQKIFV